MATIGASGEVGTPDSGAVLARSLAGGVAFRVAGPLTLTVDAGHGLTAGAPRWTFVVGFGTAFAGINPVGATSPLRRFKGTLGGGVATPSGFAKSGTGGSCHRRGPC